MEATRTWTPAGNDTRDERGPAPRCEARATRTRRDERPCGVASSGHTSRMHRLLARSLLCLAVFTLAACPGPVEMTDAGPEPADAPALDAPVDASADTREVPDAPIAAGDLTRDYCTPLATQICVSAERCGCGAIVPGGTLDLSGCVSRWTARCLEAWQPFVDAGAAIDEAAASACVAALETGTPPSAPDPTAPPCSRCARPSRSKTRRSARPAPLRTVEVGQAPAWEACVWPVVRRARPATTCSSAARASRATRAPAPRFSPRAACATASSTARRPTTAVRTR
jgi:hypothetical protein